MPSVPFEIENVGHGFAKSQGVLRVEGEDLTFEVQTTVVGLLRLPAKIYRLDLTDLDEVRYKKGLLSDRLTIRTRPLDRITSLPGAADGALCLRIKRADRGAVEAILDQLHLWRPTET
ncbi:MAG: hypothetical protein ABJF88_12295 [Rhodothermales bacterium]